MGVSVQKGGSERASAQFVCRRVLSHVMFGIHFCLILHNRTYYQVLLDFDPSLTQLTSTYGDTPLQWLQVRVATGWFRHGCCCRFFSLWWLLLIAVQFW